VTVGRQDFEIAVAAYWGVKQAQNELAAVRNKVGAGTAGSVRGGKHFDTIAALLAKSFLEAGYAPDAIRVTKSQGLELPGPSFGNNYNNRVEEALGSAIDLRRAALANLFPEEKPWLGYFFIMEDAAGSRSPVQTAKGALPVDQFWEGKSYQERFAAFCERLLAEGLYDAVCYITSSAEHPQPVERVKSLDWRHFSAAISARLAYLQGLGMP
jgi:hypothetical protein